MSENTVDLGRAIKKAIPSLAMFAIGFAVVYKRLNDNRKIWY